MTPGLTTDCAKNYCNRTLIVKVIVENVVTFFIGTQCTYQHHHSTHAVILSKPTTWQHRYLSRDSGVKVLSYYCGNCKCVTFPTKNNYLANRPNFTIQKAKYSETDIG